MTDNELMELVWTTPDCPVKLTAPDSEHPWGPEIPWPRERIPAPDDRPTTYFYRCKCRNGRVRAVDTRPMALRSPIVTLTWHQWGMKPIGEPLVKADVWLGQCPDCGRIYWSMVRHGA